MKHVSVQASSFAPFPKLLLSALGCTALTLAAHADTGHQENTSGPRSFDLLGSDGWSGHVHLDWHSRYVTEGRDNLDGDPIQAATVEVGWNNFTLGGWWGDSPEAGYEETNLSLGWSHTQGDWEYYLSYTWKTFPKDGEYDHEPGAGVAWSGLPWDMSLALDAWHSFDATGTFFELSLNKEIELGGKFSLETTLSLGYNAGYIEDGHHGWNHLGLSLTGHWHFNEAWSVHASAAWCQELQRDVTWHPGDLGLGSFGYVGIGVEWAF